MKYKCLIVDDEPLALDLLEACTGCHGIPGYNNVNPIYHVPKVGGQNAEYIEAALKGYRTGERKHPTMSAQAESLSDEDIQNIAAYFASVDGK